MKSKEQGLTHEDKMPLKDRIEESQEYGEQFRSEHSGPDQRANQDVGNLEKAPTKDDDIKYGAPR